jgi:hypothetical protein
MIRTPRVISVGLCTLSLLTLGLTLAVASNASAAGDLPGTINAVVAPSGTLTNCQAGLSTFPGPVYSDLATAVAHASSGWTIYVCAGAYDMSTSAYGANEQVDILEPLTIDGYNWDVPPSPTLSAEDPTAQSVFENGAGLLVQSANVTISGLTFYENNFNAPSAPNCDSQACASSIDVQTLVANAGDQGESNVTVSNNFFDNTGEGFQNGDVHFGLGQDGSAYNVTALDSGDVVQDNVFTYTPGEENNAVQMSDTAGGLVTGNTVTYPTNDANGADDSGLSALWFPGFDQGLTVSNNALNGGGIDSDSNATPDTDDPKSGVKIIDQDSDGEYGNGCTDQIVSNNTISGFVYDVSMISTDFDVDANPDLCSPGPSDFSVTDNTLSDARIYGIYVTADATGGTISGNFATNTDTEGYSTDAYVPGEYDYFDGSGNATGNTWTNDSGNGSSDPSTINEMSTPTTTTSTTTIPPTTTTSTTTIPPTTTTSTTTIPPTTTTSTTTTTVPHQTTTTSPSTTTSGAPPTTSIPPTTTTTNPPKPSINVSMATLGSGNKVSTTVYCANSRCSGIIELTKAITTKTEIGDSKKYVVHTKVVVLGKISYSVAAGSQRQFSIQLNGEGVKLLRAADGRRLTCEMAVTSAAGVKRENVSLRHP